MSILSIAARKLGLTAKETVDQWNDDIPERTLSPELQEHNRKDPILFLGTVLNCKDADHAGKLLVDAKPFGDTPRWVHCTQPVAGAGYGMLAIPGIGATVVVAKNQVVSDPPCDYVWLGCVYVPVTVARDVKSQPYDRNAADLTYDEVPDDGSDVSDDRFERSYGTPNTGGVDSNTYHDNNVPDTFIIKHPSGHLIAMTCKHVPGKHIDEIKFKTHGNKRIILSDAAPADGGEKIHLIDENDNQIKILSNDTDNPDSCEGLFGKNIYWTSKEGEVHHFIEGGKGDFTIENGGSGNVNIKVHKSHLKISTAKNTDIVAGEEVTITAQSRIILRCGTSTFTMDPSKIQMIVGGTVVTISPTGVDVD
jgi:hypothetical protein